VGVHAPDIKEEYKEFKEFEKLEDPGGEPLWPVDLNPRKILGLTRAGRNLERRHVDGQKRLPSRVCFFSGKP
jgi:hypothetical protein